MQLVIDIDKYDYEKVKELVSDGVFDYDGTTAHLFKSVVNGTPLPKGHCRLIDAREYENSIRKHYFDNKTVIRCTEIALDNTSTIIEADKGE